MKRNIAVIVALAVVFILILTMAPGTRGNGSGERNSLLRGFSNLFSRDIPDLNDSFNTTASWAVFQDYLEYAKNNDLEGVKSLSYQVSETCSNPETVQDCQALMNGVYQVAKGFKLEDFQNIAYDEKQIIMSTEYMDLYEGADRAKVVLYFVRGENHSPKILGIRFCYGTESEGQQCTNTDVNTRDSDKDGWWDDTEVLFYN